MAFLSSDRIYWIYWIFFSFSQFPPARHREPLRRGGRGRNGERRLSEIGCTFHGVKIPLCGRDKKLYSAFLWSGTVPISGLTVEPPLAAFGGIGILSFHPGRTKEQQ
jgi:hypothetical protein